MPFRLSQMTGSTGFGTRGFGGHEILAVTRLTAGWITVSGPRMTARSDRETSNKNNGGAARRPRPAAVMILILNSGVTHGESNRI